MIDINCDLGEGKTALDCDKDAALMSYIQRANIACGGHAGNELTMRLSIENACEHQLFIGAHPGYPDPDNFGRKTLSLSKELLVDSLRNQIDTLLAVVDKQNAKLSHIKCHGALYNDIEKDSVKAQWIIEMMMDYYPMLSLVGLSGGVLEKVAENVSAKFFKERFLKEGFMDRRYDDQGFLVSRSQKGSVIHDVTAVVEQATHLLTHQPIQTDTGQRLNIAIETLCLHGDNKNALLIMKALNENLQRKGMIG